MKTTIEHLVTPRFEVIADYPKSKFEVGSILSRVKNATNDWYDVGESNPDLGIIKKQELIQYPHLFRLLNWWENRSAEEMPKYLKIDNKKLGFPNGETFDYYKVYKWHMDILFAQVDEDKMSGCSVLSFNPEYTYQPCSEEEYLANQ